MVPSFTKIHNKFKFNNTHFNADTLKEVAYSFVKEGESYQKQIGSFLLDWLDNNDYVFVKTSGSTGNPKQISLQKQAMVASAIATGDYFNIKPKSTALHCLSTEFIAGKMMLVRAMILGLEIDVIKPNSNPLENIAKHYDFCAMVPLQLENSIDRLHKISTLIVGGSSVSDALRNQLHNVFCKVYATYGMTEAITHIAVKKLNHLEDVSLDAFQILPNITVSKDTRNCLVINAPKLSDKSIITNDVVELLSDTSFKILGRYDNVINSGGIKLFPEQIEAKLQRLISNRFFITSKTHDTLGQQLIMIVEGASNGIESSVFECLKTYEKPKHIYSLEQFVETDSGKIQREKTLALLKIVR
jgi:O-succinylbenzoic acid--CoA ligase